MEIRRRDTVEEDGGTPCRRMNLKREEVERRKREEKESR
jgi:hypothetical protein